MSIDTYTTASDVRATLGVSTTELPDSVLALRIYETLITLSLEDINVGIPALFATLSVLLPVNRTTAQSRFVDLVTLYAPYALAKELLVSLPLFTVKDLTDGRAGFGRQDNAIEDMRDNVEAALGALRTRLGNAYLVLEPTAIVSTSAPSFITTLAATLNPDPVTNA